MYVCGAELTARHRGRHSSEQMKRREKKPLPLRPGAPEMYRLDIYVGSIYDLIGIFVQFFVSFSIH